jgi:hypothetical protein
MREAEFDKLFRSEGASGEGAIQVGDGGGIEVDRFRRGGSERRGESSQQ